MNSRTIRRLLLLQWAVSLNFLCRDATAQVGGTCTLDVTNCTCNGGTVDCSGKMLRTVPDIADKSTVTYINLKDNQIQAISVSDFEGLSSLSTLDLSSNSISTIDGGAFEDLVSLDALILSGNKLEVLGPQHFRGHVNLRRVILDNNQRLTIDACMFSEVPSLETLSLHRTSVDLSSDLVVAPARCPTSTGEPIFGYTTNLGSLSIGYEGTVSDAAQLKNFPSLLSLTLNSFTAQSFGNADISTLRDLERLVLEEVHVFPKEFLISASLTSLTVTKSPFRCLPAEAFVYLPSLHTLRLLRNELRWIDKGAMNGAKNLMLISLNSNQLSTLPSGVFDGVGNSTYFPDLVITTNRWECDCRSKWLQQFLSTDPRLDSSNFHINCEYPTKYRGQALTSVDLGPCERDGTDENDYDDICISSIPVVTMDSGEGDPPFVPTDRGPTDWTLYYITSGIAVVLVVVILPIVCAICYTCRKRPHREGKDNPDGFQRRARRNSYEPREDYANEGLDPNRGYADPNHQGDYYRPVDDHGTTYDDAPTRKEEMALKVGALTAHGPSAADRGYVEGLDFGPPQRASVSYVNQAPKFPRPGVAHRN